MTIGETIIQNIINAIRGKSSLPAYPFGSGDDEAGGAQYVIQCDRPAIADRDKSGRAFEQTYMLVIHVIVHSQKTREDKTLKDEMINTADEVISDLEIETVDEWLDGAGQCTGINEQDGEYQFSEAFDDFATVAEIYVIPTQES